MVVRPLRPAYRVGHLVAAAAVASAEDDEFPPRALRHGAVVARDAIPDAGIGIRRRPRADGDEGHRARGGM